MINKTHKEFITEIVFVVLSILLMVVAFLGESFQLISETGVIIVYAVAFTLGGFFKAKEGILETINNKSLNVEILMIMAALAAFLVGNPGEGSLLIMIFAISGILEDYADGKSKKELTSLLNITPDMATLYNNGIEKNVSVSELKKGDKVIVKVGDAIPVDGIIINGVTSINESAITGEWLPTTKGVGAMVFAGTFNLEAPIIVTLNVDPSEFVLAKIIKVVNDAQLNQGKSQTKIDKFESWYVYIVILLAILFMFIPPLLNWETWQHAFSGAVNSSFYRGTVVLVVGSPCALVASIAPSMLSTLSNAARHRILVKGGQHLEKLGKVQAVVFDKTGTLTEGKPEVTDIVIDQSVDEKKILNILYSMEKLSNHPLALAVSNYLFDKITPLDINVTELPGHGMTYTDGEDIYKVGKFSYTSDKELLSKLENSESQGFSIVHIILNDKLIGFVSLHDLLRPGAALMIENLKKHNIVPFLLTGDNERTAKAIGEQVGITNVIHNALPIEKQEHVKQIKKDYGVVFMVGDGVNDAPALMEADIGGSMGSGTDVSLETADIIFMNNNLDNIPKIIDLAKANNKIILQNIIFSISVIALLLISNVFGLILLPFGVIFHEGSTILVILNSLRMLIKK